MYFDAYLKGRNPPNPQSYQPTNPQNTTDNNAPKFTPLRPPMVQGSSGLPKSNYPELRSDNNRHNTSAHIFLSTAKTNNIPQRVTSNYPTRPQTSPLLAPFSRHQLPEEQKYICHSPAKGGSRTSAGMVFDEIPQNRYDYRRSQSIAEMKPIESLRQSTIHFNHSFRQQPDNPHEPNHTNFSTSPLQVRFNASSITADSRKTIRKESVDGPMLTNREERADPIPIKEPYSHKKVFKESYSDYFQNKPQLPVFQPTKFQYIPSRPDPQPKKYDFQTRKFQSEVKKYDTYKNYEEMHKNNMQSIVPNDTNTSTLKKEGSQDFLKKYSIAKFPDLDKSLEQDIQLLRHTNKKTDQILDRQMNKNTYLNQLFEQRGLKIALQDKPENNKDTLKEKKEVAAKNINFQRELQDKNKEIVEKSKEITQRDKQIADKNQQISEKDKEISQQNLEITEKSRAIIDKNKQIETLSTQTRQLQQKIKGQENKWSISESNHRKQLQILHVTLKEKENKILSFEQKIHEQQEHLYSELQSKNNQIEQMKSTIEAINDKMKLFQSHLTAAKQSNIQHQIIINNLMANLELSKSKIEELQTSQQSLKQQSQSQKLSLISLYKKELANLRSKVQIQKQQHHNEKEQQIMYLQAEIVELKQRNTIIEQQHSSLIKQHKELTQNYDLLRIQYYQFGSLLLLNEDFSHQKLICRLRECMQAFAKSEGMQAKQLQRFQQYQLQKLQQEHLQRRHQELSRELKKVGSRLAGASIQAQQGGRLLRDANNEILLMNLMNLNVKYKFLLENQ